MKRIIYFSALAFILLITACSSPEAPEFQKLENVKFKSASILDGMNFTLTADAIFHNNNVLGADITAMDLEMFVNGKKVSDINQNVTATMGGSSDFKLPLEIKVPLKEVLKDIKPTLGGLLKKPEINYHLKGTIRVSIAGVEVNVPMDYEDKETLGL